MFILLYKRTHKDYLYVSLGWKVFSRIIQALLASEKKATEEARDSSRDAVAGNAELANKLEDAERKVDQLQDSVQRFVNEYWLCCEGINLSASCYGLIALVWPW